MPALPMDCLDDELRLLDEWANQQAAELAAEMPWLPPVPLERPVPAPPPTPEPLLPAGCHPLPEPTADERLDEAFAALDRVVALESQVFAEKAAALAAVRWQAEDADRVRGDRVSTDFLDLHLAGTLTVQQAIVPALLDEARHLVLNLPATWRALRDGWLRVSHARVIVEATAGLTAEQCARIEERVLGTAAGRSRASLRRQVHRLVLAMQDQPQKERRRREAVAERGVHACALDDGMAAVTATMPAHAQVLFLGALRQLAERARPAGDVRTVQQRMSDVLAGLPALLLRMLAGDHGASVREAAVRELTEDGLRCTGPVAPIQALLLLPFDTAVAGGAVPGELVGYGPISAEYARRLLEQAQVRTGTVDPLTGRLTGIGPRPADLRDPGSDQQHAAEPAWQQRLRAHLETEFGPDVGSPGSEPPPATARPGGPPAPLPDEPQYRPSTRLSRFVRWRDRQCIGPGCAVPAAQCDLEHRDPWPQGPTGPGNLAPVSRHCHHAKQAGWRYIRGPDGSTTWFPPRSRRSYHIPPEQSW